MTYLDKKAPNRSQYACNRIKLQIRLSHTQHYTGQNWAGQSMVCSDSSQSFVCGFGVAWWRSGLSFFPGCCTHNIHIPPVPRTHTWPSSKATSELNAHFKHTAHRNNIRWLILNTHLFSSSSLAPLENICKLLVPHILTLSSFFHLTCLFKSFSKSP